MKVSILPSIEGVHALDEGRNSLNFRSNVQVVVSGNGDNIPGITLIDIVDDETLKLKKFELTEGIPEYITAASLTHKKDMIAIADGNSKSIDLYTFPGLELRSAICRRQLSTRAVAFSHDDELM